MRQALACIAGMLLVGFNAGAAIVFQADFNGAGGASGGPAGIVTFGGTGALPSDTSGMTNTVVGMAPFGANSGNYLETTVAAGNYSGKSLPSVTFTFTSPSNSLQAWQKPNLAVGASNYTVLRGAFDIFFRPIAFAAGDSGWFRPIDTGIGAGGDGLEVYFNGNGNGGLVLEVASLKGAAVNSFSASGPNAHDPSTALITAGNIVTANQIYHAGFTFDTDSTGLVTMKMFLQAGTNPIVTTNSTPLNSATFRLDANVVGNAFRVDPWNFTEWGANHGVLVKVDFDSARLYDSDPGIFTALPSQATITASPVVLKVSDGVAPGRTFSINGEGLYSNGADVAIAPDTYGQAPTTPPADALHLPLIQTDKDTHFIVTRLPSGSVSGVYNVWAANSLGWSQCVKLNAARALFMSDYEAYNGVDIEVVGRNFDQSEFGGMRATRVRLNGGCGVTFEVPIKELNPYHVTFTVGDQAPGTYCVEVSNDNGVNWSRLASGQTLTVLAAPAAGADPLGLGVSWAKDFRWTNVFNVTNYGANPNDTNDDTAAVQSAANAAENSGGGVVYFPNGNYYLQSLSLGAGVVLEGQSQLNTKLFYNGPGGGFFIQSKGGNSLGGIPKLQGVARLSILLSQPYNINSRPDMIINLGDQWGNMVSDQNLRTANRLFIAGVNLDYPYNIGDSSGSHGRRGIGAIWIGKERVLMKDNHFTGWGANNLVTFLNQYCILKNNRFEFASGYVHDTATYLFYEDNYVKVHPEYNQDSHAYFARSCAYMAKNYVEGAGDASNTNNDGEAFATEVPAGTFNYGAVLAATTNTLTVAPVITLTNPALEYGKLSVAITCGRGLGQAKAVASVNSSSDVITLSEPFDVIPDATSKFTLYAPLSWFTVHSNTLVNCAKGIWGFGNQYDAVIADNTSIDCNGIFVWSARVGPPDTTSFAQNCPDFFSRITRNTVIGVSRRSHQGGIGTYTGRFDSPKFYDVEVYATEITENEVSVNNNVSPGTGTESPPYDGIYVSSYPFSTGSDGSGTGDATQTIIESNRLSNLPTGVTLTQCDYGQMVNGNTYDSSVLAFLSDATGSSDNTQITSNVLAVGTAKPVIVMQPQNQSALTNQTPTFTVLGHGVPAPFYQWLKNNVPIPGANSASYTAPPIGSADNGSRFSVILSNSAGTTFSSNAILTVATAPIAPSILAQPQNQSMSIGRTATFAILASGIPTPTFQWQTNSVDVPGAASSHYTTRVLIAADDGTEIRCVVDNSAGSTNSETAMLGVVDPTPSLAAPTVTGGSFQFRLQGSPGRIYVIQAAPDLHLWRSVQSTIFSNSSLSFTDLTGPTLPFRFYRAELLP
jgi:hypothetical protein